MASSGDAANPVDATAQEIQNHKNAEFATKVIKILNGTSDKKHTVLVLDEGVTDYWLPIPLVATMPPKLRDYISLKDFINFQSAVLEKSYELNRSHIPLDTQAMSEQNGGRYPKSLTYKKYLGDGGAGIVDEVQAADGTAYAVKRISREANYIKAKSQLGSIRQEIEILKKVNHTHCIKFMGSYSDVKEIGVVMDPVADDNLESYLIKFDHSEPNNRMVLASFFGCLTDALVYLHWEVNVRHKDIKPENILVKNNRVMLTDFGISLDWSEQGHTTTQEEKRRSRKYCSPEAAKDEPRNRKSDIWSLGCVFLEMSAALRGFPSDFVKKTKLGNLNFRQNLDGIRDAISAVRQQGAVDNYNPLELKWVEQMLQIENEKRLTSKELQFNISRSASDSPFSFCGTCCNTEPAELFDNITPQSHSVTVRRDNNVSGTWISKRLADLYHLEVHQASQRATLNVGGRQYVADTKAKVRFVPSKPDHAQDADCWVTHASFDLLIGNSH